MTNPPTPPYTEATGPQAEAKPSKPSDLVAQKITDHAPGCDCSSCWGIRTGFDIGYASAVAAGVAAGRAQAAADIRAAARIEYGVEHTYPGQEPIGLPAVNRWAAERAAAQSGGAATRRLVERTTWSTPWREAAERDEGSRTDVDESSLPVSTGGGIHEETPTEGGTA